MMSGKKTITMLKKSSIHCPLISVIIISFQDGLALRANILSVLNQNYPQIELIIADNHSCDFDKNKVEHFINKNKNTNLISIKIFTEEKIVNWAELYKAALDLAQGEIINFQDCKARFSNNNVLKDVAAAFYEDVESQSDEIDHNYGSHKTNVIFTRAYKVTSTNKSQKLQLPLDGAFYKGMNASPKQLFCLMGTQPSNIFGYPSAAFYRLDILKDNNIFKTKSNYDPIWYAWLQISGMGIKIHYWDYFAFDEKEADHVGDIDFVKVDSDVIRLQSNAEMLNDFVLPRLSNYNRFDRIRCEYAISILNNKIISLSGWNCMPLSQKASWKFRNIISSFYRQAYKFRNHGAYFDFYYNKLYFTLFVMLYYLKIPFPYIRGNENYRIWGCLVVVYSLWIIIKYTIQVLINTCKARFDKRLREN